VPGSDDCEKAEAESEATREKATVTFSGSSRPVVRLMTAFPGIASSFRQRSGHVFEADDIESDVVDDPVFDATAELPAVRLVHRRREHGTEVVV
jgi:hypothetical protein